MKELGVSTYANYYLVIFFFIYIFIDSVLFFAKIEENDSENLFPNEASF